MQIRFAHPYQIRTGSFTQHADEYSAALAEFKSEVEIAEGSQVTLWQRSTNERDWWLVSLANPLPPRAHRHPWVNHFAGLTLSPLFFLSPETREQLNELGWPAPPDAVQWTYAEPTEAEPEPTPDEPEPAAPEGIDVDAYAADPQCRVDARTLRRRLASGWDLDRAMSTPLLGFARGENRTYVDGKGRVRDLPRAELIRRQRRQ